MPNDLIRKVQFELYRMITTEPSVPILTSEDTWIAQRRHAGQVEFYAIHNPIETQILLNDVIKVLLYGYIRDTWYKLDVNAKP